MMLKKTRNKERDTLNLSFEGVTTCDVRGSEEEPGIIVFRDICTNNVVGFTVYYFEEYPEVWQASMARLGYQDLIKEIWD